MPILVYILAFALSAYSCLLKKKPSWKRLNTKDFGSVFNLSIARSAVIDISDREIFSDHDISLDTEYQKLQGSNQLTELTTRYSGVLQMITSDDSEAYVYVQRAASPQTRTGFGLYASCTLPPGTVVGVYGGVYSRLDKVDDKDYVWVVPDMNLSGIISEWGIDAKYHGNEMRFMNDLGVGTWNVVSRTVPWNGTWHVLFETLTPVGEGEQLSIDFGSRYRPARDKNEGIPPRNNDSNVIDDYFGVHQNLLAIDFDSLTHSYLSPNIRLTTKHFGTIFALGVTNSALVDDADREYFAAHNIEQDEEYQDSSSSNDFERYWNALNRFTSSGHNEAHVYVQRAQTYSMGFGCYAARELPPSTILGEYSGRYVRVDDVKDFDYLHSIPDMTVNGIAEEWGVDARECGNEMRFINDLGPGTWNVRGKIVPWNGTWHVVIETTTHIRENQELSFGYGSSYWSNRD